MADPPPPSAEERLFAAQLARATGPDGRVDMAELRRLVVGLYEESTLDRRRSDRAIALLAEELEGANDRLRRLVEDLRVQNLRFEAALDNMSQGLCMFDAQDRLVVVNRRYHDVTRLPPGLVRPGMTHREVLQARIDCGRDPPRDLDALLAERRALIRGARSEIRVAEFHDGERRIKASYSLLPSGGWIGTYEDVTEQRAADARAAAAARLSSLGEMAAGLAHELKQPLATITLAAGNAERALERNDLAGLRIRLGRIVAQATRGGALIDHLRRFARGWDAAAPMSPVALPDAVEGALTLIGARLREAGIAVVVDLPSGLPPVQAFQMAIEQVLLNLLLNAFDALAASDPAAERRVAIRAAALPGEEAVRIEVADTAGGLPELVLARLFQPFVTTKGPDGGTGLGLSICHGLVTTMGGEIGAHNGAEGAVFHITLRAARA